MVAFTSPVDIANRALQHCGATRIASLTENSRNASEVSFCADKLREAELRRNVWVFSIKEAILRAVDDDTMLLDPALWVSTTTYFKGSIVADQSANLWKSTIANNLANDPLLTTYWEPYFGPLTVSLYDSTVTYSAGELVYTAPGDGTYRPYLSLQNDNADVPATATDYDATVTYFKNQVVTYLSVAYMSLIDLNIANTPSSSPAIWASGTTYGAAAAVAGSDGIKYTSIAGGNIGNDPTTDGGVHWTNTGILVAWTTVFTGGTGSIKWLQIGGAEFPSGVALTKLDIQYPLGSGPSSQSTSRNAYRLPAGYLRAGIQNAKGTTTWLGGPTGNVFRDWDFESGYLVSADVGPIRFRFAANVTDVRLMDPMFCEALGARIGLEVCEVVTQSTAKVASIASFYKQFMTEARTVNAIETGYEDAPDDDWISVRN